MDKSHHGLAARSHHREPPDVPHHPRTKLMHATMRENCRCFCTWSLPPLDVCRHFVLEWRSGPRFRGESDWWLAWRLQLVDVLVRFAGWVAKRGRATGMWARGRAGPRGSSGGEVDV